MKARLMKTVLYVFKIGLILDNTIFLENKLLVTVLSIKLYS